MATIYQRKDKGGAGAWRVMFRRKGIKTHCRTFLTEEEAIEFSKREKEYIEDPKSFWRDGEEVLRKRREREMKRNKNR